MLRGCINNIRPFEPVKLELIRVTKDELAVQLTYVLVQRHVQALVRCQNNLATCFLSALALRS
jgi:hypothetical protein